MAQSSSVPVQRYQGVQKESAGYRLLTSMGWKEGEGLGASKQGIKEHIRVKKNYENWGVGAVTAADRARDWSKGMMDFHRVLSNLSEITSQHATIGDQGDSDEESDASDAEAKHGSNKRTALKISKKKDRKEKKKKKKKKGGEKTNKRKRSSQSSDRESDTDDGSETKLERSNSESVKRVKFATHVGRFKKRENAKMVKNYSHNDLAAILGCGNDAFPSFPDALGPTAPPSTESSADEAVQSQNDSDDQRQIQDKVLVGVTNQNTDQFNSQSSDKELQIGVEEPANVDTSSSLQADLWWSSYFCRSGRIGSSSNNTTVSRPRGFSENDQTSLYAAVQGGATQGRMGLGRSSMPKKVGGARWAGKKVRLDNDSDDEDIAEQNADSYKTNQLEENKHDSNNILNSSSNTITIIYPRKKSNDGPASKSRAVERCDEGTKEVNDDVSDSQSTSNKWKRIVKQVLAGFDKDIKFKKLVKTILENHNMEDDTKEEIEIAVASVLQSSSKFAFDGKKIKHIKAK